MRGLGMSKGLPMARVVHFVTLSLALLGTLFRIVRTNAFSNTPTTITTVGTFRTFRHVYSPRTDRTDSSSSALGLSADASAAQALERTKAQLAKIQRQQRAVDENAPPDPLGEERERLVQSYVQQSANALKEQLKTRGLPRNGRKPDLARRLAEDDLQQSYRDEPDDAAVLKSQGQHTDALVVKAMAEQDADLLPSSELEKDDMVRTLTTFATLRLSPAAGRALGRAQFDTPTPIQAEALPRLARQRESLLLHAETGSGKTLAYVLPITERLWLEATPSGWESGSSSSDTPSFAVILTPTRELAAQVAGIATVLAPPGSVRLVTKPTNLMRTSQAWKERGELEYGGRLADESAPSYSTPRLFIGSAKAIMHSLYGDGRMPASPTSKPEAMQFLKNCQTLVLDEVDRLLAVKKTRTEKSSAARPHEKPAAVVAAAVARLTLGQAQIVAASATVGRPLKRELARVLGLPPPECPATVRGAGRDDDIVDNTARARQPKGDSAHIGRAVTIPDTVENYVVASDGSSTGQLLTTAYKVVQGLHATQASRKILLVLARGFGLNTQNAIGALRHFDCQPPPQSLLDRLEADGTDRLIAKHRQVSGAAGVGESSVAARQQSGSDDFVESDENGSEESYLLVTGEDTVRGLHLDGLDVVVVVGRPNGPDEYTHIAGRTGRAGRTGKVINVVSQENAAALKSWERMLGVDFTRIELIDIAQLD